ncbi:MAG: biotin--[acetyl-CoA-carboxylase] ligase [Micromonosporaceae bacterium]
MPDHERVHPYSDLSRPPLAVAPLRRALVVPGGRWTDLQVVAETGSTNEDLVAAARAGAPAGRVLVAEQQSAGRGRLARTWLAPARAGLTFSVLLRPVVPAARLGWLPLLAGVALAEAVGRVAVVEAVLKWPNDLLVGVGDGTYAKCAGLLAEAVPAGGDATAVVLGIGLNVGQRADELPPASGGLPATSLAVAGAGATDRDPLLRAVLRSLAAWLDRWEAAGGDPSASGVGPAYRSACRTLGAQVRLELPDGRVLTGLASDVDADGRLVLIGPNGAHHHLAAGDLTHLR